MSTRRSSALSAKIQLNENKIDKLPDPIYSNYVAEKQYLRKFEFHQKLFEPTTVDNEYYKKIRRSIKPCLPSYMYARNSYYKFYQDNSNYYPNLPKSCYKWDKMAKILNRYQSMDRLHKNETYGENNNQKSDKEVSRSGSSSTSSSTSTTGSRSS